MSKKSKKILAYLMFVAALCGTPAVSEARGGSDGQVKTEKASTAQRGNFSQSFISYILKNYGFEAVKWMLLGGAGYGTAKVSDLKVLARHALGIKNADLRELTKLKRDFNQEKQEFGKEVEKFKKEKSSFEQLQAKAINNNEQLVNGKVALEMKVNNLLKQAKKDEETIEELKNRSQSLNNELVGEKNYNAQLFNVTKEDKRKLDLLSPYLSNLIDSKMSGEFTNSYSPESKWNGAYRLDRIDLKPFSIKNVVRVALVEYNAGFDVVEAKNIDLGTDDFLNNVKNKAKEKLGQDATNEMIALKDIGLSDFGVPGLARYSFVVMKDGNLEKIVAAYFPVADAQQKNVENNGNDENINENNNVNNENIENIENNENVNVNNNENVVNNENVNNENIENNENGNINENNNVNNEENNENLNENVNVNDNNVDNNNLNNEVNENNV